MLDLEKIKERWAAKQLASFHHALIDIDALVAEVERLRKDRDEWKTVARLHAEGNRT